MKYLTKITFALIVLALSAQAQTPKKTQAVKSSRAYPIQKSDSDWKKILSPVSFQVMVKGGTEPPFNNAYHGNHEKGIYVSAATGEPLFSSEDKFESGTGWPSFTKAIKSGAIAIVTDTSHGMVRKEVVEAKTGLHLGHVFDDGPKNKGGKRYCMNSAALKFIKQ
ncbi:peptide-methionine (R)-S-oxide reductase MsrB [Daejeonella sp.]|uniref:peptide-methionine (R)-S-oxide reductase MsrB n=1 Tax=Daejeonella sp. TaxID=2805397 RepID=UPI0030BA3A02